MRSGVANGFILMGYCVVVVVVVFGGDWSRNVVIASVGDEYYCKTSVRREDEKDGEDEKSVDKIKNEMF